MKAAEFLKEHFPESTDKGLEFHARILESYATLKTKELQENQHQAVKDSIGCWVATRINGASAGMGCSGYLVDVDLLKIFDEKMKNVKELREENPTLQKAYDLLNKNYGVMVDENEELSDMVTQLVSREQELREEIERLKTELKSANGSNFKLNVKKSGLTVELDGLKKENELLQVARNNWEKNYQKEVKAALDARKELKEKDEVIEEMKKGLQDLVDAKQVKDSQGKTGLYMQKKEAAWKQAKELLNR